MIFFLGHSSKEAKKELQFWKDNLDVIIAEEDRRFEAENDEEPIYEQLRKYEQLREDGVLSQKEFDEIKSRLLDEISDEN